MAEEESIVSSSDEQGNEALQPFGLAQDRLAQEGAQAPTDDQQGPEAEIVAGPDQGEEAGPDEASVDKDAGRVRELEAEIGRLRSALDERDGELAGLREQVASAAARYRSALLAGAPEVPEELLQGQTVEELDESLAAARRVVDKVARQLEARVASERVPSGAPPRREPDLGALSAREKILYALQKG